MRKVGDAPEKAWVMRDFVETKNGTCVPFTTDYMLDSFSTFVRKGRSLHQQSNFLRFIGDATHDESSQGLKKLVLGVAGTHFHNGKWQNTVIPIMFVVISQESKDILKLAMDPCYFPSNTIRHRTC